MQLRLFITTCMLGGIGGFLGSVVGAALGDRALFVGGFLGGIAAAPLATRLALWRQWISRREYWPTTAGAALGFLAAATVAVNTLSSPVGPILSTALTGIGAVMGKRFSS
jgi:hypothetical protein